MIENLRTLFHKRWRPLVIWHIALGLALVPVPFLRTGIAELMLLLLVRASDPAAAMANMILLFLLPFLCLAVFYWVWCLSGANRSGLPKRSLRFLAILVAYYPIRLYLNNIVASAESRADIARMHGEYPIVWLIKHLDAAMLVALVVWAIARRDVAQPQEKMWFHWLMFLTSVWMLCALVDSPFGFVFTILLSILGRDST